jgi:hypothetical protein
MGKHENKITEDAQEAGGGRHSSEDKGNEDTQGTRTTRMAVRSDHCASGPDRAGGR